MLLGETTQGYSKANDLISINVIIIVALIVITTTIFIVQRQCSIWFSKLHHPAVYAGFRASKVTFRTRLLHLFFFALCFLIYQITYHIFEVFQRQQPEPSQPLRLLYIFNGIAVCNYYHYKGTPLKKKKIRNKGLKGWSHIKW